MKQQSTDIQIQSAHNQLNYRFLDSKFIEIGL